MGVSVATIKGSVAFLEETIVAVPFQGRGLGRALLDAILNHLMLRGVRIVMAQCPQSRGVGLTFLERYGFEVVYVETANDIEGFRDGQVVLTLRYILPG